MSLISGKSMIPAQIFRLIHTNGQLWQFPHKSLIKLCKSYPLTVCYKALELYGNDMEKAETWLKKEALQYGRAQAAKLKSRDTSQGLVAVMGDGHYAALAEVNCETDFVAGDTKFRCLVETVVSAVLNHAKSQETQNEVQRTIFHADNLKDLLAMDGKPLSDHSALAIGYLDENINLRRALALSVQSPDVTLFGCTDLAPMNSIPGSFGKCGALVAIKSKESNTLLGTQLCDHIIAMQPQTIGNLSEYEPYNNVFSFEEERLIYQQFITHYPSFSVQEILAMSNAKIVDFARFVIDEDLDEELDEEPTL